MLVDEFENLVRLLPREHQIALLTALEADIFQHSAINRQPHRVIDDMPPLKRQRHNCAALLDGRDHARPDRRGEVARIIEVLIRYEYHSAIDAERFDPIRPPDIARQDALSLGIERNLEDAQLLAVRPNLIVIIKHEDIAARVVLADDVDEFGGARTPWTPRQTVFGDDLPYYRRFANAGWPGKNQRGRVAVLVHTAQHHLRELQLLENRVGRHLGFILRQCRFLCFAVRTNLSALRTLSVTAMGSYPRRLQSSYGNYAGTSL